MNWKLLASVLFAILVLFIGSKVITPNQVAPASTPTVSANVSSTPSIEWQTYSNQDLHVSFKYPSGWTFEPKKITKEILSGTITSPKGLLVDLMVGPPGVGGRCNDDPNINMGHEPITIFGEQLNLHYHGDKQANQIFYAYVIKDEIPCPNIAFFDLPSEIASSAGLTYKPLSSITISYPNRPKLSTQDFKTEELDIVKQMLSQATFLP